MAIKVRPPTGDFDPRALSFNQPNQDDCHTHFYLLHHVDGCHSSQECLTFLIPSMLRIAKTYSCSCSCHVSPPTIKQSGLMLLLLKCGDVAMNPGLVMLGSVNARSIRNKGPLLSDTTASHAFDFLCLTETHICTTDSDSFLHSLNPDGFSLIHKPRSIGIDGGVGFIIRESYKYRKVDTQIIVPLKILSYQFQFRAELCS